MREIFKTSQDAMPHETILPYLTSILSILFYIYSHQQQTNLDPILSTILWYKLAKSLQQRANHVFVRFFGNFFGVLFLKTSETLKETSFLLTSFELLNMIEEVRAYLLSLTLEVSLSLPTSSLSSLESTDR